MSEWLRRTIRKRLDIVWALPAQVRILSSAHHCFYSIRVSALLVQNKSADETRMAGMHQSGYRPALGIKKDSSGASRRTSSPSATPAAGCSAPKLQQRKNTLSVFGRHGILYRSDGFCFSTFSALCHRCTASTLNALLFWLTDSFIVWDSRSFIFSESLCCPWLEGFLTLPEPR